MRKAINIMIYMYILLKPIYIFESGGLQIADLFIVVAFILTLCDGRKMIIVTNSIKV